MLLLVTGILLMPLTSAGAEETEKYLFDEEFKGKGSAAITFRTYIEFEIYDGITEEFLDTIYLNKIKGSAIDGTYHLPYDDGSILVYRNDGNKCYIEKTHPDDFKKDLYLYLYGNPDQKLSGREKYYVKLIPVMKVYARKNKVGPYNGDGWRSLEECVSAHWTVDTTSMPGGTGSNGAVGDTEALNDAQRKNIMAMYEREWTETYTPEGTTAQVRYDGNGGRAGKIGAFTENVEAYCGYCTDVVPEYEGRYFWGWSRTKYEVGKGPKNYAAMYHAGDPLSDVWKDTILYAVWGYFPFGTDSGVHNHIYQRQQRAKGRYCPICGQPLYFWAETCRLCGAFHMGEDVPHTCPPSKVIFMSGECNTCHRTGPNVGHLVVEGTRVTVVGIEDTGLRNPGHRFVGWNLASNGSSTWLIKGDVLDLETDGRTVYVFAIWEPLEYTLHFDYGGEGYMNAGSMVKGEASRIVSYDDYLVNLPIPYLRGFDFEGWYSEVKEMMLDENVRYGIAGDSTAVARWGGQSITVEADPAFPEDSANRKIHPFFTVYESRFDMDYGTRYSDWIPLEFVPTCDGYSFVGWSCDGKMIDENTMCTCNMDHVIKGVWTRKRINVTLDPMGGVFSETGTGERTSGIVIYNTVLSGGNMLPKPKRPGYSFDGWYTERFGEGTAVPYGSVFRMEEDVVLYAKWIQRKYAVDLDYCEHWKYDAIDLAGNDKKMVIVTYGETAVTLPSPTRYGYKFIAWSTGYVFDDEHRAIHGDADGRLITKDMLWDITDADNLKLYAVWSPVRVNITYDFNYDYTETVPLPDGDEK